MTLHRQISVYLVILNLIVRSASVLARTLFRTVQIVRLPYQNLRATFV